jgi:hypothetical protein
MTHGLPATFENQNFDTHACRCCTRVRDTQALFELRWHHRAAERLPIALACTQWRPRSQRLRGREGEDFRTPNCGKQQDVHRQQPCCWSTESCTRRTCRYAGTLRRPAGLAGELCVIKGFGAVAVGTFAGSMWRAASSRVASLHQCTSLRWCCLTSKQPQHRRWLPFKTGSCAHTRHHHQRPTL